MADPLRFPLSGPPTLLVGDVSRRARVAAWARRRLIGTLPGMALLVGLAIKLVLGLVGLAVDPLPAALATLDAAGTLALVLGLGYLAARGAVWVRRRLLWRVRRKLILSYVFVGLVPSLLIVAFFLLAGLLLFRNMASYLVQTRINAQAEQARFLAQTVLLDVQRAPTAEAVRDTLERQLASGSTRYPFLSIVLVPARELACPQAVAPVASGRMPPVALPTTAGPWAHLSAPLALPSWMTCDGIARVIAYDAAGGRPGEDPDVRLVARAVAVPPVRSPTWAVVLDLPISAGVEERMATETGIRLGAIDRVPVDESPALAFGSRTDVRTDTASSAGLADQLLRRWVVLLEHLDWASGASGTVSVQLSLGLVEMYRRLTAETALGGAMSNVLLVMLAAVATLFLLIQGVALLIGLALARQITGAVHDLFTGTQHLRNRDFTHVIPVRARDQLGELAESFNAMTGEVTRLLSDVAQKERLEQEFATAREIQMKLLPQGPLTVPGLGVSAYCEPAREVGGDYYDVFPVGEQQFGFLIADVSGKGVGAGLYMAQLKGLVLSLVRQNPSPRDLLISVNRVIADHLDGRSFITMSYLVVDVRKQVMTYARAGHCPLLLVPARRGTLLPPVKTLAPDGLVVGLKLDDGTMFESLLEEVTVPLVAGDLVVLFTDGISEMMNREQDCFGEGRLGDLAGAYRDLPLDQLAATLIHEVRAFGAGVGQHDDMTMLLLRAEALTALGAGGGFVTGVEVVFRTRSEIEARVVEALLESQGLPVIRMTGSPSGPFAFSFTTLGEIRIAVASDDAAAARRVLETHGDASGGGITVPLESHFDGIEMRIGYRFRDRGKLEHALTHKSRTAEDPSGGVADNESLEFLGDAILGFVAADVLYRDFPQYTEGPKSKAKAALVSTTALAGMSRALGLGDALLLGRGEEKTGGRTKQALLADVFEAVIAAIYLDGGIEPAQAFVERQIRPLLADVRRSPVFGRDHKSALQERLQGRGRSLPMYRIAAESGPDHQKEFRVEVTIDGQVAATGTGRTKKDAEQEAARLALEQLASSPGGFE